MRDSSPTENKAKTGRRPKKRFLRFIKWGVVVYFSLSLLIALANPIMPSHWVLIYAFEKDFSYPQIEGFVTKDGPAGQELTGVIISYCLDNAGMVGLDQKMFGYLSLKEEPSWHLLHYVGEHKHDGSIFEHLAGDQREAIRKYRFSEQNRKVAEQIMKTRNHHPGSWLSAFGYRTDIDYLTNGKEGLSIQTYFPWDVSKFYTGLPNDNGKPVYPANAEILILPFTQPRSAADKAAYRRQAISNAPHYLPRDILIAPYGAVVYLMLATGIVYI